MKVKEIESTIQSKNVFFQICMHFESSYLIILEKTVYATSTWFSNRDLKVSLQIFKVNELDSVKRKLIISYYKFIEF